MKPIRIAVIGAGHLGRIHAKLLKLHSGVEIVSVVDPQPVARQQIEDQLGLTTHCYYREIADQIDAAIIATPTAAHHEVAADLLNQGVHVLIEKPITSTVQQADQLIHTADQQQAVLQVGHVERFNPAFVEAQQLQSAPRYIEASRMSGFTFRSTDVGVVQDLMIHDIDLVASMVHSPLIETRAIGMTVFGPHEDIAQARLEFANGTVANLTASRCSFQPARNISWFSESGFVSADLNASTLCHVDGEPWAEKSSLGGRPNVHTLTKTLQTEIRTELFESVLPMQTIEVEKGNAIEQEQIDFVGAIVEQRQPRVTGRHGRRALTIAESVLDSIKKHQWTDSDRARTSIPLPTVAQPAYRKSA